jgi:heme O synthase-like polyprenyltransferase
MLIALIMCFVLYKIGLEPLLVLVLGVLIVLAFILYELSLYFSEKENKEVADKVAHWQDD